VLSDTGKVLIEYPYLKTPYPLSPNRLISIIEEFVETGPKINRITVGLPGMIRDGKVVVIPHYINAGGPRTAIDQGLKNKWFGFDMQSALKKKLKLVRLRVHQLLLLKRSMFGYRNDHNQSHRLHEKLQLKLLAD
jgi:polyphosphate glucokinase